MNPVRHLISFGEHTAAASSAAAATFKLGFRKSSPAGAQETQVVPKGDRDAALPISMVSWLASRLGLLAEPSFDECD